MPGRGEIAEAIDLMFIGAETQNRKELEQQYQKTMKSIFGLPEDFDVSEWDHEKKYKMIIAFCSRDRHLREVRNQIPAVFTLIEYFLQAKETLGRAGLNEYERRAGESIDMLLNEIYMRAYPDFRRDAEIDLNKAKDTVMGSGAGKAF